MPKWWAIPLVNLLFLLAPEPTEKPHDKSFIINDWRASIAPVEQQLAAHCSTPGRGQTFIWLPRSNAASNALQLLQDWPKHPLAEHTQCMQVRWYTNSVLNCRKPEGRRLTCSLPWLPYEASQRHVLFIDTQARPFKQRTQPPLASSQPDVIQLPHDASTALFAHEIGHWLGLVDEYPMAPKLARAFCKGRYQHPSLNIVTTHKRFMSATELKNLWQALPWRAQVKDWRLLGQFMADKGGWQLGSSTDQAVGLFASRTCENTSKFAWKPVAAMTAMEYHDIGFWPAVYLELIEQLEP